MDIDLDKKLWTLDGVGRKDSIYLVELEDDEIEKLWEQFNNWNGSHVDFYFKFVNPQQTEVSKIELNKQDKVEKTRITKQNRGKKKK